MRWLQSSKPDIIVIILLFLMPLLFFFPQTLGGKTLIPAENLFQYEPYAAYSEVVSAPTTPHNHLVSDLILQNYQWKSFIRQQLAQGEVPLWNPHQLGGIPFLAAGQHSALYPLSVVYYILPLSVAYGWFTVLNLWLAGVFMYLFLRGMGVGRTGSMLAGVVYQFSGFVIASVVFQMMIGGLPWLPLMLLMSEYILRRKKLFGRPTAIAWTVIGAGAIGMNVLAGHVEITIYCLLITGYFAGMRLLYQWGRSKDAREAMQTAAWLLAMVALGIGLAAVQFLPLYDFVQSNWRAERNDYDTVVSYAHPIRDAVQFAMPNFYGNPAHHQIFDVFTGQTVTDLGTNQPHTEWGIKNYVESALYVGILPLLLALYAVLERILLWLSLRRNRKITPRIVEPPYRLIFALLGILSLTFMFGLPTYRLIYALPGINQLNSPFRWIFGLTVCVAVLAGFGLDALQRRAAETSSKNETRIGYGLIGLAVLLLGGLGVSYVAFPQLEPTIERLMNGLALATQAFSDVRLFYSYQFVNLMLFAVMLLLSGVVFLWVGRMRMYRRVRYWSIFAVGLVALDLMIASWGFNPASDPAWLEFEPPAVQWLREQYDPAQPFRYTTLEAPNTPPLLNANSTMRYGLDDIRGYDSIIPRQYMDYLQALAPQVQRDYNRIAPLYTDPDYNHQGYEMALDSPLFDLLNVRYVVTRADQIIPFQEWSLPYADDVVRIWENDSYVPRFYLVAAEAMPESWLPPTSAAPDLLARDVIPPYAAVSSTRDTAREKFFDLILTHETWFIASENYADGWKAFIRPQGTGEEFEQPLTVELVAGMFQGVHLDTTTISTLWDDDETYTEIITAGNYTLRLVYSPTSIQVGFFGSAMSAVILTFLLGSWLWTIFVGVNTAESSQTAKVARNSAAPIILNLFNRGIDFVLAIVLYRLLSQEMVGVYNFAVVVFIWFDIFTNFGLDLFLIREVSRDKAKGGFYLFNTSFVRFGLSVIGLGMLLLFLFAWQSSLEPLPYEGLIAIVLLYIGLFPASLNKGMTSLYYAHEQAEKPAAIATITTINKAVFYVIVLMLGWGIVGLAGVSIVLNFITLGVLFWHGRGFITDKLPKRPDFKLIRNMLRESYPLLLNHFLATIFFQIDIVILQAMRGAALQAQYSTSYKWLNALNIIPAFFTQALFPMMSRQGKDDRAKLRQTYSFGIKLLFAVTLPLAIGITIMAETMTLILAGAPYLPTAAIALQIMIWSIPIGWMNSLTQYALIALDLQRYITRAFFVAVLFNIITNIIFIPQYGFYAAAVTTILSELVLFIPFVWLMHRGLGQAVNWLGILWRPIVAGGAMIVVIYLLGALPSLVGLIIGGMVYVGVLLALRPLDDAERAILHPMIPNKLHRFI